MNSLSPWQYHSSGRRQTNLQINKGAQINKDHQGVIGVLNEIKQDRSGDEDWEEKQSGCNNTGILSEKKRVFLCSPDPATQRMSL